MTQKDKELLLKDLSARLPYGVICRYKNENRPLFCVSPTQYYKIALDNAINVKHNGVENCVIEEVKPYLFPLSSMTEEQKKDIFCNGTFFISNRNELGRYPKHSDDYDYVTIDDYLMIYKKLIENHFDINGLIPKGLAIDATGLNIY